jgi:putative endonuclease
MPQQTWWVYVVRRQDGALYTGIALDVGQRLAQHRSGCGAKALRGRGPLVLVRRSRVGALGLALRLEHAFKQLPKARKEALTGAPQRWRSWLAATAARATGTHMGTGPLTARAAAASAASSSRPTR